jgi:hypothetical protein
VLLSLRRKDINLQKFITLNHRPSLRGGLPALLALLQTPALQTPILQTPIIQTPLMARISVLFVCLIGSRGNLNGIISSNIYRNGPKFTARHSTFMTYLIVCLLGGSIAMRTLLARENKKPLTGQRDHWNRGMSHREAEKLGDKQPDFIFTLRFLFLISLVCPSSLAFPVFSSS